MRLSDYLRADLVLTDLTATDLPGILRTLGEHLEDRGLVPDASEVIERLGRREEAHSTAMGHGMALPHATIAGLSDPVLMVALARETVQFGPPETEPVRAFFVLLSPPGRESEHIKLLARICRLVRHPGFVDELHGATTVEETISVIRSVDEEHV